MWKPPDRFRQNTLESFQKATEAGDRVSTSVISNTCSELMGWELLLPKGACKLLRDQIWSHLEAACNAIASRASADPEASGAEVPSPDHFKAFTYLLLLTYLLTDLLTLTYLLTY